MIAALFVEKDGPYCNLPNVAPWTIEHDARKYEGPYRVIAHPPCQRWGRYWFGGPSAKVRRTLGDDDGCFASALRSVRTYGGVLEHPEATHAFKHFGLGKPPKSGGWILSDDRVGYICCVEQGHYGHPARKATWLYVNGVKELPHLIWGPSSNKMRMDDGFHSAAERAAAKASGAWTAVRRLSKRQRLLTPEAFRDLLIRIANS